MSATMMNCNHYQSTPLSPPVTPKTWFSRGRSISPELQLPPIFAPSPPSTVVSDASKYCYKEQQQEMLDPILFTIPFTKKSRGGRSKSTPHRSPPASARGTFTLDIGQIIAAPMKQMKKRKSCTEETHDADANGVVSPNTILEQRHYKKQKTDAAAAYDKIDILIPDHEAFTDPAWIPNMAVFDEQPHVRVVWKGNPLKIDHMPYYELLYPGEVMIASTLRLTPEQYLKCKRALVLAAFEFHKNKLSFRKSDAQKCVRIDVNKTSTLWGVFYRLGWFKPRRL